MSGIEGQTISINIVNATFFSTPSSLRLADDLCARGNERSLRGNVPSYKKRFLPETRVPPFSFTTIGSPNRDSCLSCTRFLNKKKRRRRGGLRAFRRFSREGESHVSDDPYFSRLLIAFSPEIGIGQVIRIRVTLVSVSLEKRVTRKKRDDSRIYPFVFLIWEPLFI